jgi:apolipoprotein N-acyltransferase
MVPLWDTTRVRPLLWWLAVAFVAGWLLCARVFHVWPFATRLPTGRPSHRSRARLAALALGALPMLAFPAPSWWWSAWASLVPLLLLHRTAPTAREAAVQGWWAGAGYIAASAYWLVPSIGPALPLVAFGLGALWVPWGWAARRMLAGRPSTASLVGATLVLPSGWVAIEAVRSWQSLGGPWALLGVSQWNQPTMLASAALGGVWLTGFLVVTVNVAVVVALVTSRARLRVVMAAVAAVALTVGPAWAALRPTLPDIGQVRVGVVQPGAMGDADARLARQIRLSDALAASSPDLIVWGESSVGYDLPRRPRLTRELVALTRRTGADLLVNVDARSADGTIYKTSVLVTPDGVDGTYVKTRLVPFGEYIPLRGLLGWLTRISEAAALDRGRGDGPVLLRSAEVAFGPLICFESTFPDMARREVALGADMLVYQTASTTFQGTWAQPQHAAVAAVRAVETGRPVVHVALTGTSAAYDATGTAKLWIPPGERTAEVMTLTLTTGSTPYVVSGDWLLIFAAAAIAGALVAASLAATRPRGRPREQADAVSPLEASVSGS